MASERQGGAANEGAGVSDRANNAAGKTRLETRTASATTTKSDKEVRGAHRDDEAGVATVEELGRQAGRRVEPSAAGHKFVTSLGAVGAQSGQSRIVAALLRDGDELQLRVQEMRPGIFEVGANLNECRKFLAEHQKLLANLAKHKQAPVEGWLAKYKKINQARADMGAELRLVYMCMAENLQGCWRGLLLQLEQRQQLLEEAAMFYAAAEQLFQAIERADGHVQAFRRELLEATSAARFNQAAGELRRLNGAVVDEFERARRQQRRLVELIGKIATGNLADSRANLLMADAQSLAAFIQNYIEPLERRKIQLENVLSATSTTTTTTTKPIAATTSSNTAGAKTGPGSSQADRGDQWQAQAHKPPPIREIDSFTDLRLVEGWLGKKLDQLNSSLLSSLGASAQDARSILNKHEQIALECSAIEEATLTFRGRSIHALGKQQQEAPPGDQQQQRGGDGALLEQQRQLAARARDVITMLDARIALLRRTIDFYSRAREANADIAKMMRRLHADNSLQAVQFVSDELELKDVSSVVASGATIISELQQLQLAQQHGQRSKAVGLQLATGGIRAAIDQLNQELAHLKTVLNQRRLVLLNEDAGKMAQNFSSKCQQLKFWLEGHARSFLLSNNRLGVDIRSAREFCDQHDELRQLVQQKTLEVEALLRLLSSLTESLEAKSLTASEIQRDTDELRQDWISATNCLDQRLELARKYLAILGNVAEIRADIEALEGAPEGARPRTPDERPFEDIEARVGQALAQLANQVRNFTLDAQRSNTSLVYSGPLETKPAVNDVNKQQVVGHANGSVKLLQEQLKTTLNRLKARGPRRWEADEGPTQAMEAPKRAPAGLRSETETRTTTTRAATSSGEPDGPPRFERELADAEVEPFSAVVLECELAPGRPPSRVEWLLNNKRIPANIKHSISSEANRHRLTIGQFGPVCCGTYSARATNQLGAAATACRLRLSGIREDDGPNANGQPQASGSAETETTAPLAPRPRQASSSAATGAGQNRQVSSPPSSSSISNNRWQQQANKERALERIIQGVESPMSYDEPVHEQGQSSAPRSRTSDPPSGASRPPVTRLSYDGAARLKPADRGRLNFIDSPSVSSSARSSVSRSPFEGTPQPPAFAQALSRRPGSGSAQAGLVCVVIGNPPPSVEWLHEGRPIASARCAQSAANPRANVCKLTIETVNDRTLGQYVCRATNRLGQSSTALTLSQ